ncbi:hypothetical protein [Collimonas fungivorans]|uniref:hypothetical protein n=1 Tax=Collimonas fungivorans TaxID=158899 RepID=UPI0012378A07|nr:hypothetical protein [Collimonas fungivorans]
MPSYEIIIGRMLKDGRVAVTNNSATDVPLGTTFITAFWTSAEMVDGEFHNRESGTIADIDLTLKSVDVFRRQVECIPKGYSAAVELAGSGLSTVLLWLDLPRQKTIQIILRAT